MLQAQGKPKIGLEVIREQTPVPETATKIILRTHAGYLNGDLNEGVTVFSNETRALREIFIN
ncbi:hypothetical protein [Chryseolinea soli]|uniref:Uncharacterized protein n=1 Tax=Chryseolinea soli TaxID=2321403 RepID=A0A385SU79_9BACT|nr:hypothetical protein [Chryseolinea soli]AYB34759.1 hypothetical protein D4L85_31110 [Chryseolinea soli]